MSNAIYASNVLEVIRELYAAQDSKVVTRANSVSSVELHFGEDDVVVYSADELYEAILSGDSDVLMAVFDKVFHPDYTESIFTDGKGFVFDKGIFRIAKEDEVGLEASNRMVAFSMIVTTVMTALSGRNDGSISLPKNINGDICDLSPSVIRFGSTEEKVGLMERLDVDVERYANQITVPLGFKQVSSIVGVNKETTLGGKDLNSIAGIVKEVLTAVLEGDSFEGWLEELGADCFDIIKAVSSVVAAAMFPERQWLFSLPSNRTVFKEICKQSGLDNYASNLFVVDSRLVWFDREFSIADLRFAVALFSGAAGSQVVKGGKGVQRLITIKDHDAGFDFFVEADRVTVDQRGVRDHRNRWFQNMIAMVGNEPFLVNNYGTVVMALVEGVKYLTDHFPEGQVFPVGSWYRKVIRELPMDAELESGGVDAGERRLYNDTVAVPFSHQGCLPWEEGVVKQTQIRRYFGGVDESLSILSKIKDAGSKVAIAAPVLEKYNLVQMHKGNMSFFAGSMVAMRLKDLREDLALAWLVDCAKRVTGLDAVPAVKTVLGIKPVTSSVAPYKSEHDFLVEVLGCGLIGFSTKLSKITKRVTLGIPKHAEPIDGVLRALERFEQGAAGRAPGHRYSCGYFPNMIYAPGMSILLGNLKPFIVRTSTIDTVEAFIKDDWSLATDEEVVIEELGNGETLHSVEGGYFVKEGDAIVNIGFKRQDGSRSIDTIIADKDCTVTNVRFRLNSLGALEVRIKYFNEQTRAKIRQNFKCMITRHLSAAFDDNNVMYNSLNTGLLDDVETIIPGDGDKAKDLIMWLTDVFAETAVANGDTQVIEQLNAVFGEGIDTHLVWCELLATMGHYNAFINDYIGRYGRSVWFKHVDAPSAMLTAVRDSYLQEGERTDAKAKYVKRSVEELINKGVLTSLECFDEEIPMDDSTLVVTSKVEGEATISDYDEVFVFYTDEDGNEVMWQRSFGFIGNKDHGHLYINAKVELSSIDQTLTVAPIMFSSAQLVDTGISGINRDSQLAWNLMKEGRENMAKFSAIHAMVNRQELGFYDSDDVFNVLPTVNILSQDGTEYSEEFKAIASNERVKAAFNRYFEGGKDEFYDHLSTLLKGVVLNYNLPGNSYPYIWLPAITAQSARFSADESLTGMVGKLLYMLVEAAQLTDIKRRMDRIRPALMSLSESNGLVKSCWQGRKGLNVKVHAVLGVELTKFYYLEGSEVERELGKLARKQGNKRGGAFRTIHTRSPLPFANLLTGEAIAVDDPRACLFDGAHVIVNPLVAYINGGDFDGMTM